MIKKLFAYFSGKQETTDATMLEQLLLQQERDNAYCRKIADPAYCREPEKDPRTWNHTPSATCGSTYFGIIGRDH